MNKKEKAMFHYVWEIAADEEEIQHWGRVAERFMNDGETPDGLAFVSSRVCSGGNKN